MEEKRKKKREMGREGVWEMKRIRGGERRAG